MVEYYCIYKITYKFDYTIEIKLYYDEEESNVPDIYDIEGYNFHRMYVATFKLPNGKEFKLGPLNEMNYEYVYNSLSNFIQTSNISGLYFDKAYNNQLILTSYEAYQLKEDITIYIKLKLTYKFNYTFIFPDEYNFEIIGNGEYYNGEKITLTIKNVIDELKIRVFQAVYDRLRKENYTILDYSVDINGIRLSFYASARNYSIKFDFHQINIYKKK